MNIFEPVQIGTLSLSNRVVMAPMTRSRVGPGDVPTRMNAQYYAQRASSGLIVTEAIVVSERARGYLFTPGLYTDEQVEGWREVTSRVHDHGGKIFAQLWHTGRVSHTSVLPPGCQPVSSTDEHDTDLFTFAIGENGRLGKAQVSRPVAMTQEQIKQTISEFGVAAANAQLAGFDGVEILGANGYLIEQFLNSAFNRRTDEYGNQSPENLTRFLLDIVDDCQVRTGANFPVAVRLSPFGFFNGMPADSRVEETYMHLAHQLRDRQIAYVHFNDEPVSVGHLNEDVESEGLVQRLIPRAFMLSFKREFGGVVMVCGGLCKETAQEFLDSGAADLVAFGIPFIANPDLVSRLRNDWPLAEPKTDLFYGGDERGYSDYPNYDALQPASI